MINLYSYLIDTNPFLISIQIGTLIGIPLFILLCMQEMENLKKYLSHKYDDTFYND